MIMRKTSLILFGAAAGVAVTLIATQPRIMLEEARAQAADADTYRQLSLFGDIFERLRADYVDCEPVCSSPSALRWPRSEASPRVSVRALSSSGTSCSTSMSGEMPLAWMERPDGVK